MRNIKKYTDPLFYAIVISIVAWTLDYFLHNITFFHIILWIIKYASFIPLLGLIFLIIRAAFFDFIQSDDGL